jgi:hypothetical protein
MNERGKNNVLKKKLNKQIKKSWRKILNKNKYGHKT